MVTSNLDGLLCLSLSSLPGAAAAIAGSCVTVLEVELVVAVLLLVEAGLKVLEAEADVVVVVPAVVVPVLLAFSEPFSSAGRHKYN